MGKVEEKSNSKPGTKSDHRIHEEVKHQNSPVLAVLVFYEAPPFPFL